MPKYYEGKEQDTRPCAGLREDLKDCLLHSSCVLKDGKTPKQCVKEGHCKDFYTSFFECKRSLPLCCESSLQLMRNAVACHYANAGIHEYIKHSAKTGVAYCWTTPEDSKEERDIEAP